MTCGLYGGIEVAFLRSGAVITPLEVTTRSESKKFNYTKATIKREDGEFVSDEALEYEPVELRLDGVVQDRYMYHPEAVDLHNDDATLTLYDAEKVLERGSLNHHYDETTLRDVITDLIERREDPNRAIVGINHPADSISEFELEDEITGGHDGVRGFLNKGLSKFDELSMGIERHDTSLRMKEDPPMVGIKELASAFALSTWVDTDGFFNYRLRGSDKNRFSIGPRSPGIRLKEYNVTVGSGKVGQVLLHGAFQYTLTGVGGIQTHVDKSDLYSYGKAWLVDDDGEPIAGRTLSPDEPVSATTPAAVEDIARAHLINHYMNRKSGNIVLNSGASTDIGPLTELSVGDLIRTQAEIEDHCERNVDTGIFIVQRVQHKLDKRRGWLTDVGVAALPFSDIASESWVENPEDDEQWDSVKAYKDDTGAGS